MNGLLKGVLIVVGVTSVVGLGLAAYKYIQPNYLDDFEHDFYDEDSEPVGDVCYD